MPSAYVGGILGFVVFVVYYLVPISSVRKIVPQSRLSKLLFFYFFLGSGKANRRFSNL